MAGKSRLLVNNLQIETRLDGRQLANDPFRDIRRDSNRLAGSMGLRPNRQIAPGIETDIISSGCFVVDLFHVNNSFSFCEQLGHKVSKALRVRLIDGFVARICIICSHSEFGTCGREASCPAIVGDGAELFAPI